MRTMQRKNVQKVALPVMLSISLAALLAGCGRGEQAVNSANAPHIDQPTVDEQPLGQVTEFDGFTLRANVSPTELLPDAMVRKYGIEAEPNLFLLDLVVLEKRPGRQSAPVSAELSAHYESLIGHIEVIDMREVEADGHVSYIGTLDASAERVFRIVIEAQPEDTDQLLRMNFEVQLDSLGSE